MSNVIKFKKRCSLWESIIKSSDEYEKEVDKDLSDAIKGWDGEFYEHHDPVDGLSMNARGLLAIIVHDTEVHQDHTNYDLLQELAGWMPDWLMEPAIKELVDKKLLFTERVLYTYKNLIHTED